MKEKNAQPVSDLCDAQSADMQNTRTKTTGLLSNAFLTATDSPLKGNLAGALLICSGTKKRPQNAKMRREIM